MRPLRGHTPPNLLGEELESPLDELLVELEDSDMARRLPNNELMIYPDAGHAGIFQFHEQFVERALEFLAK